MKNLLFALLVFVTTLASAQHTYLPFSSEQAKSGIQNTRPISTVSDDADLFCEVHFDFPGAFVNSKTYDEYGTFQYIFVDGFASNNELGKPALPTRNQSILIPGGVNGVNVEIIEQEYIEYDNYRIHPALKPASDTHGAEEPSFEIDEKLYSTNAFYPAQTVKIARYRQLRGMPIALVNITPVQYNPVTQKIRVYSKIKYRVNYSAARGPMPSINKNSSRYNQYLRSIIANPSAVVEQNTDARAITNQDRKDYIILTHDAFKAEAVKLASWKKQLGFTVEVVSRDDWTSELVDFVLKERYNSWVPRPDYFVIIGDHDGEYAVPGKIMVDGSTSFASDNRYSCMDGIDDYEPDIAKGRIPARSVEDAQFMIDKIINYEKNPTTKQSYYTTSLNCAYYQDDENDGYATRRFCQTSEEIKEHMLSKGYNIERIYATDSDEPMYWNNGRYSGGEAIPNELHRRNFPWLPAGGGKDDIVREWNEGKFLIFHRDHGYSGGRGWADPHFMNDNVAELNNTSEYPVVFSINCHTGQFIETECFSELLMTNRSGGAAGVLSAAQASYSGSNDALVLGFYDAIWPGVVVNFTGSGGDNVESSLNEPINRLGDVLNYGLSRMLETWPAGQDEYQCDLYHYFGDPSMEIRTKFPTTITASIATSIQCNDTELIVSDCNVQNAIVTLVHQGRLLAKTSITNGSGTLVFDALGSTDEDAIITIYAHNTVPLVRSVSINGECSLAPLSEFECSQYVVATGASVEFQDLSQRNVDTWQWSFTPKSVEFINGTSATSANPVVKFLNSGRYAVELMTTNEHGENTISKLDYIVAKAGAPSNISSTIISSSQIDLSWDKNLENDMVMVAYSTDGVFGTPVDGQEYQLGESISGGGQIAYVGDEAGFLHNNLDEFSYTHYKLWSFTDVHEYSYIAATHANQTAKSLEKPYLEPFTSGVKPTLVEGWKAINNSDTPWETMAFTSTSLCVGQYNNNGFIADDWLFSPGLEMKANKTYRVSFKYRGVNDNLIVNYGLKPEPESANQGIIFEQKRFYGNTTVVKDITPSQSGVYYLAFYHYGQAQEVKIDDVSVVCMSGGQSAYWLGGTANKESDWMTASNWTGNQVPANNMDVYIGANRAYYPHINESVVCNELYILDGGQLTIENKAHLTVNGNLWNGGGTSGEFIMNGGRVDINQNYCGEDNSLTDINDGTLNIAKSWIKNLKDGYHFCRGKAHLSGGAINIAENVAFGGNSRWEGIMDGPVVITVGNNYRNFAENWTITDGTVILTGAMENDSPTIYSSQDGSLYYNLIIDGENEFFDHGGANEIQVLNDLVIKNGDLYIEDCSDFTVEGNMTVKSGVTFYADGGGNHTVNGDLNIECGAEVKHLNNILVNGTLNNGNLCGHPVAEFSSNVSTLVSGTSVQFTDQSLNTPNAWAWTFEGGSITNSASQNPVVTYNTTGTFAVGLEVSNSVGSDAISKTTYITVVEPSAQLSTSFSSNVTSVNVGGIISFTDVTRNNPSSWHWTFDGGTPETSTQQHPTVTYEQPGIYSVTLEVDNANGSSSLMKENYIVVNPVTVPVQADFVANQTNVNQGATVEFSDFSANEPIDWLWSFEGGTPASSKETNPVIEYTNGGIYEVSLTAYNAAGYSTEVKQDYIQVLSTLKSPRADFSSNQLSVQPHGTIAFMDKSTNTPTAWLWTFEGGNPASSTEQNPSVSYANKGAYTVTLNATNQFGESTKSIVGYVTVEEELSYCEPTHAENTRKDRYINLVKLQGIDNTSGFEDGGYADYTNLSANLTIGHTYPMTVSQTHNMNLMTCGVWIDWNRDGDFEDDNELVYQLLPEIQSPPYNFEITVPATIQPGKTRMRVRTHYNKIPFVCGHDTKATGEAEDYTINIVGTSAADACFGAVTNTIEVGESVKFSDTSLNTPTSWQWNFEGGTPSTSNEQHPTVVYDVPGVYNVRLQVETLNGTSERTELSYITVTSDDVQVSTIEIIGDNVLSSLGAQLQLSAILKPNTTDGVEVDWSSDKDEVVMVDDNGLVTAQGNGKATITATLVSNPSIFGTLEVTVSATSTLVKANKLSEESIYPNPFDKELTMVINSTKLQVASIKMFDVAGELVYQNNRPLSAGNNAITIRPTLTSGIYLIKIQADDIKIIKKIVKQ